MRQNIYAPIVPANLTQNGTKINCVLFEEKF